MNTATQSVLNINFHGDAVQGNHDAIGTHCSTGMLNMQ